MSDEKKPIDLKKLRDHFPASEIEFRIGRSGKSGDKLWASALAYITNRAIMNRLDEICGPENWWNEYREWIIGEKKGVLCGITIRTEHGPVCKWDGAEPTDIESVKGGLSDSMKRAAVQWGLGRYLYNLEETFVDCSAEKQRGEGWNYAKSKDGVFYWKTPDLPKWALPVGEKPEPSTKPSGDYKGKPKEEPKKDDKPKTETKGPTGKTVKVLEIPLPKDGNELDQRIIAKLSAYEKILPGIGEEFMKHDKSYWEDCEPEDRRSITDEWSRKDLENYYHMYMKFLQSKKELGIPAEYKLV